MHWHGFVRDISNRTVATELYMQTADYPWGPVKERVSQYGTGNIDLDHNRWNIKCARVYAKDPCIQGRDPWVGSDWACFGL
jgi:hypothetical protein